MPVKTECDTCGRRSKGDCNMDCAARQQRTQMKDFIIQYLYSEHSICAPDDEAAPYTAEELKAQAIELLARAKELDKYL